MHTLCAIDALIDRVPVFESDRYPADLAARERSSQTTHVAVVDAAESGRFLGLLGLKELMERRRGAELTFGDLVARTTTLRVGPQTPLLEVVDRLIEHKQDAAAVLDTDGQYLGTVTVAEARQRLVERRAKVLAEGERHFRSIFEQVAVGVAQVAPDGRWMEVNPRLCTIVGYTREELLATTLSAIIHPDDQGIDHDHMLRLLAGEMETYSTEKRYRRKDGEFIWVNATVSLVRDVKRGRRPLHFVSVVEDINARKLAEVVAAEAAASLELAVKASNIGLWDWDLRTNRACFSRVWKSQLGYAEHEIADEYFEWERRVHPDDLGWAKSRIERCLTAPYGPYEVEFRMRHKDGSWRWMYTRGEITRDAVGTPIRMLGCHVDVTESKRLTKDARASAALLRATIDALAFSTAVIDRTGRVVIVNRWWRAFAAENGGGYSTGLEGVNYLDVCDQVSGELADDSSTFSASLRSVLAGGSDPMPMEYACHSPTQKRWFQAWIHGFSQGADRFAVITHQDVTAVRLAAGREAANQQRKTVAIIAAGVAHEFNSLLFAAALQLHRHLHGPTGAGEPSKSLAVELIQQAQSLASALLDLYSGPATGRTQLLSLYPWLRETVARLATVLPPGIHVTTEVEFDLPEAIGHALGLEQVLRNLLFNAANVLGDRGEIRVRAALASIDGRPMIEIRVSDNGPGIPESLRSQVFEPGFTTKTQAYRSGLGLAIATQLLEQFRGSLSYEPVTPTGSTFIVRLDARLGDA